MILNFGTIMMESKYQCPFCKYMSLKKWNVKKHVENIHGIKNYGNANIKRVNIDQQNMRQPEIHTKSECPIQHQHDVIPHYQSKYQPSQEDHQYSKRFKDASTQYSENDINHSTAPYLIPSVCVCKERKPFIVYNAEVINEKNVQFRKELFQKVGAEIVSIMESNFLPLMK